MAILVNTLLRSVNEPNKIERVVWLNSIEDACFIADLTRNSYPTFKHLSEINQELQNGTYIIEETDPHLRILDDDLMSEAEKAAYERAWKVVQYITQNKHIPNVFIPTERAKLIRNASSDFSLSEAVIKKYLKRYFIRGMTKSAVMPDLYKCGAPGKRRSGTLGKKRGRPRINPSLYQEMNVSEQDKEYFRKALEKHYYQKNKPSLRWTYQQLIRERYTTGYKDENKALHIESKIPTFGQFRYWFEVWRDEKKEVSTRDGSKKYQQRYRPVLGTSNQNVVGPGSSFEIDATNADIYLVSSFDRKKIIGRPTIYLVCDTYSRLVVGLYIGLENPSWSGASMALLSAGESKVEYCQRYGIEIHEEDWPSGLPISVIGDRGEVISDQVSYLIENLHINVKNTPSYRPDQKSIVEKMFDLIQSHIRPHLPGAIQSDFQERGSVDYRLESSLTLEEYIKIVLKCIIYYNTEHYLSGYERNSLQIANGVAPIPLQLWDFGMKQETGLVRKVSPDILRLNLMPRGEASVTFRGIRFNGIFYSTERAINERWFVQARMNGSWKVDVSYDPRNLNLLYLRLNREDFEICSMLESQAKYDNKSLDEITFLNSEERHAQTKYEDNELQSRIKLATEIDSIVASAKSKSRAERSNESKASRLRGIRENREEEKQQNRQHEAFVIGQNKKNNSNSVVHVEEETILELDDIQLLISKQRENFNE